MSPKNDEMGQFPFRDREEIIEALRGQAALRGRSLTEELRLAARIHLHSHMLAQLDDPLGRAEAEAQGHDVKADAKVLKGQLADLRAKAFARPLPPRLRDSLLGGDAIIKH